MIGHCLGAAGAIEMVAVMLQMKHGFIHPSLNTEALHPDIEEKVNREKIPLKTVQKRPEVVAKSSFGFGDVNSCLILQNWKP
jgi:3-oxoacyl-(acyl-carrier-protein) synthase